ncbi:AT-hook motif nuclear-localized protein 13-like isoform X1 [Cucurbita moschata]|uniref:AT-hook motif nuclear-localized protein n=1 Tax=Cucurbita moschata TaxID=3662 RepID=A0A6J1EXY5_CUCMO|nr:AT-hook motif nuclear-localized protein 13-like isoform X1 [Cucurbita moschata]
MDSLDTPPSLSAPSNMTVGVPTAYSPGMSNANNNASSTLGLNPATAQMIQPSARFPFNSVIAPASVPLDSMNVSPYDGSHSGSFNADSGKKKRGRPRKYTPDGNIALGLAPTTMASSVGHGDLSGTPDLEQPAKKARGRPPGSGKKQMNAIGSSGVGFTPHVVWAKPGEDVAAKILAFSQQGPRTVFILSANGSISNATLRHSMTSGGSVTYEGQYEIISLSGSFMLSENNGTRSRTGGLSVLLAGSDGQVLGGGVAGMLMASSQVQVVVGSFLENDKKSNNTGMLNSGSSASPSQMINFGGAAAAAAASPPSLGASSGESSADNGGSPLNNRHPGMFSNSSQPIHNMQMYHQLWAGQTQQ